MNSFSTLHTNTKWLAIFADLISLSMFNIVAKQLIVGQVITSKADENNWCAWGHFPQTMSSPCTNYEVTHISELIMYHYGSGKEFPPVRVLELQPTTNIDITINATLKKYSQTSVFMLHFFMTNLKNKWFNFKTNNLIRNNYLFKLW